MKRFMLALLFIVLMALTCLAITPSIDSKKTYKNSYKWTGRPKDKLLKWAQAMEDAVDGTTGVDFMYFVPGTAPDPCNEGDIYYDSGLDALRVRTSGSWETLEAGGDYATLDEAYRGGYAITVDGTAITLTVSDSANNQGLIIAQNDVTNNATGLEIVMGTGGSTNTGYGIYINGVGSGTDIKADNWQILNTGVLTCIGVSVGNSDIVFTQPTSNDITLKAEADGKFTIAATSREDLIFNLYTADTIKTETGTSADKWDWGDIDEHSGFLSIAGDAGADFDIGVSNSGSFNLVIAQAGAGDNELRLTSAGTATNAIALTSATGGIALAAVTSITGTASAGIIKLEATAGDITIDATDSRVIIDGAEAVDNAVTLVSAGGGLDASFAKSIKFATTEGETDSINFDSAGGIDFDISGAAGGEDFAVTTDSSITMTATEDSPGNIHIEENGGSTAGINIYANQGEAVSATTQHSASIQLHSDVGGIGLYTNANLANAIRIETDGGSSATLHIMAIQGTGASAAAENDASIQLESTLGGIGLLSKLNAANAIRIEANGGVSETINILANLGTANADGAASIQLLSDAGAIGLKATAETAAGEKASAIQLTALLGAIELYSGLNGTNAIKLTADGGTNSDIVIYNDTGNTVDSIQILTDLGGITLTAKKPFKIEAALTLNDTQTFTDSDATPDVNSYSFFETNTTTYTLTDFDGSVIEEGQIIVVLSRGAITYDVDGGALIAGTTDLITADGDVTMWIYDGTNWQLISWMDDAADQNTKG